MPRTDSRILRRFRHSILGLTALGTIAAMGAGQADARFHRHHGHSAGNHGGHDEGGYEPPYAAIVVDANSGRVLESSNPDSPRHPASLTKIMTLYLLFEQLESGRLRLESRLSASAHAAAQDPSKLGLEPGQSITVEDAIKAVVTKSANDVAVVIAEAIGGSEAEFARLMTRKAHAIGMTRTTYVNASGLPNDEQITTARDQALLGRAIQDRFPRYYHYFSTLSFQYHGIALRNHNHLLGRVDGIDGIKTGYTRASGFNLVSSVHRGDRRLVAVVLGGTSGGARDARMRGLIEAHIGEASTRRTVTAISEQIETTGATRPRARAALPELQSHAGAADGGAGTGSDATMVAAAPIPRPGSADPIQPIQVKTISVRPGVVQTASLAPLVTPSPQATVMPTPMPASATAQDSSPEASAAQPETAPLPPPPPGARPGVLGQLLVHVPAPGMAEPATPVAMDVPASAPASTAKAATARGAYMIQVGAFPDEAQAQERLRTARSMAQTLLGNADPFTERVVKGSKEFYRARFVGLDKDSAEAACQYLHRNDIVCMALRNN